MSDEISEYQKVAAIVCWDIDIALEAAKLDPEQALSILSLIKEKKDKVIADADVRDMRYSAIGSLAHFMDGSHKE